MKNRMVFGIIFFIVSGLSTGTGICELILEENNYWKFVSDFIFLEKEVGATFFKTGIAISNCQNGSVSFTGHRYLVGDIIGAERLDDKLYALGRLGFVYELSMDGDTFVIDNELNLDREVFDFAVDGDIIAVMSLHCVQFFDIKDNMLPVDSLCFKRALTGLTINQDVCFIADGTDSLIAYNADKRMSYKIPLEHKAERIYAEDDLLFIFAFEEQIRLYKIGEAGMVEYITRFGSSANLYSSFMYQDTALYVSLLDDGIIVYDLIDLADVGILTDYGNRRGGIDFALNDSYIALANGYHGLDILIRDDDYEISQLCSFEPGFSLLDVSEYKGNALVALGRDGFAILDGDNDFEKIHREETGGFCRSLCFSGMHILVAIEGVGVNVYLPDSLDLPQLLHTFPAERAFAVNGNGSVIVYSDFAEREVRFLRHFGNDIIGAETIAEFPVNAIVRDIQISDDICAIALDFGGLSLYRIFGRDSVVNVANIDTEGNVRGIHIEGRNMYIADGQNGILCYDISVPEFPRELWRYDAPAPSDITMHEGLMAISSDTDGTVLYKLEQRPRLLDTYYNSGLATKIEFINGHLLMADQYSLFVFSIHCKQQ